MQLTNILFVLQLSHCVLIDDKPCDITLISIFHDFFLQSAKLGDVKIGKFLKNTGEIENYAYIGGLTTLDSNETYLILTQKESNIYNLYYWIGMHTSLADKKVAAKHAMILSTSLIDAIRQRGKEIYVHISREKENMESKSFLVTFCFAYTSSIKSNRKQYYYSKYRDTKFPLSPPNLYIVKGVETTRIKSVPVNPKWLKKDSCLILESGYRVEGMLPLSIYCGPEATCGAETRIHYIILHFQVTYTGDREIVHKYFNRDDKMFKIFVEVLENSSFSNPYEIDDSNDHLKDPDTFVNDRDQNVKFYYSSSEITQTETPTVMSMEYLEMREMKKRPMLSIYFQHKSKIYMVDTASIAGIILLLDKTTKMAERVKAIEYAEQYLHHKESTTSIPQQMRIMTFTYITPGHTGMFDFQINLADYPSIDEFVQLIW